MKKSISIIAILAISLSAIAQQNKNTAEPRTAPINGVSDTLRVSFKADVETVIRNGSLKGFSEYNQANKKLRQAQEEFSKNPESKTLEADFVNAQKELFKAKKKLNILDQSQPLFIVDGKVVESLKDVDQRRISYVSVLKDDAAMKKYGEKARNGVVEVHIKKEFSPEDIAKQRFESVCKAIDLKENQKAAFEKIYNRCEEVFEQHRKQNPPQSKAQTYEQVIKQAEFSVTIPSCKLQMYKDLKKVLTEEQIVKLYNAERSFMSSALRSFRGPSIQVRQSPAPKK